jgi:hypothetical protein
MPNPRCCLGLLLALTVSACAAPLTVHADAQAMPGKPQAKVVAAGPEGAEVRVEWAPPARGAAPEYSFRAGGNDGFQWKASGKAPDHAVLLTGVPMGGNYWFCVRAAGKDNPDRCNSFTVERPPQERVQSAALDSPGRAPIRECDARPKAWIWCDDFERDRTAAYFEASMPRQKGIGRGGSFGAVGRFRPGEPEGGNLKLAFGRTPHPRFRAVDDGSRNYREIYWRFFVKKPADWRGGGADKLSRATVLAGGNWEQAMIAHVWAATDGGPKQSHLKIDPASGTDHGGRLRTTKYNDFDNLRWIGARTGRTAIFDRDNLGQWQCIEARVRLNDPGQANGLFELWVNDRLDAARDDIDWLERYDGYGINAVFLENYWNKGSPVAQERYMDNFIVSTARIGCG